MAVMLVNAASGVPPHDVSMTAMGMFRSFLQIAREEVAHGGETRRGFGGGGLPAFRVDVFHRIVRRLFFDVEKPDVRIVCGGDLVFGVIGLAQTEFHVGLPGCEPDIADQDVRYGDRVISLDGEFVWSAGGLRL